MTARWALRQRRRQTASGAVAFGTRSARTNAAVIHSNTQVMMVEMDNNTDKLEQELGKMDMQNLLEVQQDDGELVDICSMAVLQHGQQQELQVKPLMERGVDDSMLNSWQAANGQQKLCGSTMSISVAVNIGEHGDATLIEQVQQREQQNYHQEANEVRCEMGKWRQDQEMTAGDFTNRVAATWWSNSCSNMKSSMGMGMSIWCCSTLPPCPALHPSPPADLLPSWLMLMTHGVFQHRLCAAPAGTGCPKGLVPKWPVHVLSSICHYFVI